MTITDYSTISAWTGGGGEIRTRGPRSGRRFSRPVVSTAHPPLRYGIQVLGRMLVGLSRFYVTFPVTIFESSAVPKALATSLTCRSTYRLCIPFSTRHKKKIALFNVGESKSMNDKAVVQGYARICLHTIIAVTKTNLHFRDLHSDSSTVLKSMHAWAITARMDFLLAEPKWRTYIAREG